MFKVDRAVARIERWGSAEDRAALSAAIKLLNDVSRGLPTRDDRQASRQAIIDIAQRVKTG
jgi:hypothetical protein